MPLLLLLLLYHFPLTQSICPAGHYNTSTSCEPCARGSFFPIPGANSILSCIPCPPNTFSSRGSSTCSPCPSKTFSGTFSSACGTCPPSSYLPSDRRDDLCVPCPGGSTSFSSNSRRCIPFTLLCPSNSIFSSANNSCIPCPAGSDSHDAQVCYPCFKGFFHHPDFTHRCTPCPPGMIAPYRGATKCIPCPRNTARPANARNICRKCSTTTFTNGIGNSICTNSTQKHCPPFHWRDSKGDCRSCTFHQYYSTQTHSCTLCPVNTFSTGGNDTICKPCSTLPPHIQHETACSLPSPLALKCHTSGGIIRNTTCQLCPLNTYQLDGTCIPCKPHTINTNPAIPKCTPCPACTTRTPGMAHCKLSNLKNCKPSLTGCEKGFRLQMGRGLTPRCICDGDLCTGTRTQCKKEEIPDGEGGCQKCKGDGVDDGTGRCVCTGARAWDRGVVDGVCKMCPHGEIGRRVVGVDANVCVGCPRGSVLNTESRKCVPCADGSFAMESGMTECTECAAGWATFGRGAAQCVRA